ncbi:MAG: hypothetical protein A2Z72_08130 [Omnitrophica bacterium RBG_13_46_9]|nr:MAG: hypothetical protein A2Z72_08130 [Omnitrophica bacterium RBG_13_46_9]
MKKKMPHFKSEKEEAEFWRKNSPLDYPDEFKEVKTPFQFSVEFLKKMAEEHREKKKSVTLRIEPSHIYITKIIAKYQGDYYQALFRKWIMQGIRGELLHNPKIKQSIRASNIHLLNR